MSKDEMDPLDKMAWQFADTYPTVMREVAHDAFLVGHSLGRMNGMDEAAKICLTSVPPCYAHAKQILDSMKNPNAM